MNPNADLAGADAPRPAREPVRSDARLTAGEEPAGGAADCRDVDLSYLDAVDLASALSFPASDPPAFPRPDRNDVPRASDTV